MLYYYTTLLPTDLYFIYLSIYRSTHPLLTLTHPHTPSLTLTHPLLTLTLQDREKANWIREKIENRNIKLTKEDRVNNFERLAAATKFEHFLGMKFNDKRYYYYYYY